MSERLSAWMDGELEGEQARQLLKELDRDVSFREDWACYHVIGDALRGVQGSNLSTRIFERIDSEPFALAPQWRRSREKLRTFASSSGAKVSALGLVAAFGLMSMQFLQQNSPDLSITSKPQLRRTILLADEGAKEYLLAHQSYSPSYGLQGLAVYVRAMSLANPSVRKTGNQWKCDC